MTDSEFLTQSMISTEFAAGTEEQDTERENSGASDHGSNTAIHDENATRQCFDTATQKDCLLAHMNISVTEAEKRATSALNIRDFFTVYVIQTRLLAGWVEGGEGFMIVWRRYTEFEWLHDHLESSYPWAVVPPLPEKRASYTWHNTVTDTFDPDFVDRRRAALENFLHRVAAHSVMSRDKLVLSFLRQEDNWHESVADEGYIQKAETKLKALSVGARLKQPDKDFENIKHYSNDLQSHLSNVLHVRAKLASRIYSIHKLYGGYGRIFSEWSAIEKGMGDGLQRAGHLFDSLAAGIETALEDEELIADQLKEYMFFASSLQGVCTRQELLQLQYEQAQDQLEATQCEKARVLQGRYGLMSRLFGSVDTEEVKELRVGQLQQRIDEDEANIKSAHQQLQEFMEKALHDVDAFHTSKVAELKHTLSVYLNLQTQMAKKGLQTWKNIHDYLGSIP